MIVQILHEYLPENTTTYRIITNHPPLPGLDMLKFEMLVNPFHGHLKKKLIYPKKTKILSKKHFPVFVVGVFRMLVSFVLILIHFSVFLSTKRGWPWWAFKHLAGNLMPVRFMCCWHILAPEDISQELLVRGSQRLRWFIKYWSHKGNTKLMFNNNMSTKHASHVASSFA